MSVRLATLDLHVTKVTIINCSSEHMLACEKVFQFSAFVLTLFAAPANDMDSTSLQPL